MTEPNQSSGEQTGSGGGGDDHQPYVPSNVKMAELTIKAMLTGVVLAVVLGAANAYVGMKAGLTVAATFPATVMALAILRPFRGTVLEQNIARTTASVGEALIAGAIFTIPAFVLTGVWKEFSYLESTLIMLVGGMLGVLFVTFLRRVMVKDKSLPFPESVACAELTKAGQAGQSGAKLVFGAMGLSAVVELFKNDIGIKVVKEYSRGFIKFRAFASPVVKGASHSGGLAWCTPSASPMLMGVGYIIGWRLAALVFSGGIFAWGVLVPVFCFGGTQLDATAAATEGGWLGVATTVWAKQVRPLAVGAMIVAAFHTLYRLGGPLKEASSAAFTDLKRLFARGGGQEGGEAETPRVDKDLPMGMVLLAIVLLIIPVGGLYWYFTKVFTGAIVLAVLMVVAGLLFAAVAGYLVGLIGSSNNPISGLTLSTLLIAAVILSLMGITGSRGVMAVLGVAAVICCALGVAGDMMQDLKVGYLLGGTPWKMQTAELIGIAVASVLLTLPMIRLHQVYVIGSDALPAPQAGLMAMMARGILDGKMAWSLVIIGGMLALTMILLNVRSVMLVAVGMYLPFFSTAAIFLGGLFKAAMETMIRHRTAEDPAAATRAENSGILLASGLIAGESMTAIVLAFLYLGGVRLPSPTLGSAVMNAAAVAVFVISAVVLIVPCLRAAARVPESAAGNPEQS